MKSSAKHMLIFIVGLALTAFSLFDMLRPESEDAMVAGDTKDGTSFFYLIIGVLLGIAGIMGLMKEKNNGKRKKY